MKKTIFLIDRASLCLFLWANKRYKGLIDSLKVTSIKQHRSQYLPPSLLKSLTHLSFCEIRLQLIMRKISINSVILLLALTFLFSGYLQAQQKLDIEHGPLKYGQLVPKSFWTLKHKVYRNGKISEENFSALKGKIILLDFWATWCTSCIHALPKTNSLAKKHIDIANIILVNSKDTQNQIDNIYKVLNSDSSIFSLPSIVQDTTLKKLFPISMLPQYIWIDRDGRFIGLTSSYFVDSAPFISIHKEDMRLDSVRKKRKEGTK